MSTRKVGLGLVGLVALLAAWRGLSAGPHAGNRAAPEEEALEPAASELSPEEASESKFTDLEIPEEEFIRSAPPEEQPVEVAEQEPPPPESLLEEEGLTPTVTSLPQELVEPEELGWVRGRLLAENGSFEAEVLDLAGSIVLELESFEPPAQSLRAELELVEEADGNRVITFAFEGVAMGAEYELTLSSLGNQRWEPTRRVVRAPIDGVEFMRYDLDEQGVVTFRVSNAETGEAIDSYRLRTVRATTSDENGVFLHTGPLDPEKVPMQGAVHWTVDAPGFAPAYGDEASFFFEDGQRVCEIELLAGWATRFLVLGTEPRLSDGEPVTVPLRGAEVFLDGVAAGRTTAEGTLVCRLPEAPSEIEVRHGALVHRSSVSDAVEGRTASQRGNVSVVLMRKTEEPEDD